jgi:hypothetical protein
VAVAESNGDAQARQMERPALRETSKGWPDAQRPTVCFHLIVVYFLLLRFLFRLFVLFFHLSAWFLALVV